MPRAMLAALASLFLAGCWVSEELHFGPGDWANLAIDGHYVVHDSEGEALARVLLVTRPDGLVASTTTEDLSGGGKGDMLFGMVAIAQGSGRYFLVVDRESLGSGEIYVLAHRSDEGEINLYWPNCEGTPKMRGLVAAPEGDPYPGFCMFTDKRAVMEAALRAERFLAARHIVRVSPFARLSRTDTGGEPGEEECECVAEPHNP